MHRVDVAIIGAGSAGLAAHAAARRQVDSLLLIERGPHGTTCARSGCMPSKLLVAAAEHARAIRRAGAFGLRPGELHVDRAAVMQRVRSLRDGFVRSVLEVVERIPVPQRLDGSARFVAADTLQVGDQRVQARAIVVATGSTPWVPPAYRGLGERVLTSDEVFELPALPESLAVIGGGIIGLELGQAFAALGVRVRLFAREHRLGPVGEADFDAEATRLFADHVEAELGVEPEPVARADGIELRWCDAAGQARSEVFERVLVATGRRPALDDLGLEQAGLQRDERGVPHCDPLTRRCGDTAIYLAGDVDHQRPLLHEAAAEGRIAGDNAARHPHPRAHRRLPRLEIAFTEPQHARVGLQADEIAASRRAVGEVAFARQGRSRVIGRAAGRARLYGCRETGKLLGARLLGPETEHLAHLLAWSLQQELSVTQMLAMPFYHPTIEEGLRTALVELRRAMDRGEGVRGDCMDCGPGG